MTILYDHQIFSLQKYGGISKYFAKIIEEFKKDDSTNLIVPLLFSNNYHISDKILVKHLRVRKVKKLFSFLNARYSIYCLNNKHYNIFHPTYYDIYFLKHIGNKPFVLTVYDMIHERFRNMFSLTDTTSAMKRLLVNKASRIISISNSTKMDLMEIYGIEESKINVVYLANPLATKDNANIKIDLPDKYILFVGMRTGYKNFIRFVNSVANILKDDKNLHIVCVGGGKFRNDEIQLLQKLNIQDHLIQYDVEDNSLPYFYKNALCLVFPSLYEGFGLPILEAFSCDCPVVCSNTSSFPEVAGDAPVYFNPYDENSIENSVETVIYNPTIRTRLIEKGKKRLKYFSWSKTASETKKVYESIL